MKNIATALLRVQSNLDPVHKGRKGYGYSYADLPAVMNSCMDALNQQGIVVVQSPTVSDKQCAAICTHLIHADSGEEITSTIEVPYGVIVNDKGKANMTDAQAYGSAMTYARRYALVSMLGIVTEDNDGATAGNRQKVEVKPVVTEEDKSHKAEAFANAAVMVYREMIEPEEQTAYIKTNWSKLEACLKYPAAEKVLKDAGLV